MAAQLPPIRRQSAAFQFSLRSLLVLMSLICCAVAVVSSDAFYQKRAIQLQRAAHAFDSGGGYTISETAVYFEGVHSWLPGRRKVYAVLLGEAGMGVQDVAGAQINILEQNVGSFRWSQRHGAPAIVWDSPEGERVIPTSEGQVFEGSKHQRWDKLFDEKGDMLLENASHIGISASALLAFFHDGSTPYWNRENLKKWAENRR